MDTANHRASSPDTDRTPYRSPLFIAGGNSAAGAIDALFALDEPCGTCISSTPPTIATLHAPRGWDDPVLPLLQSRLSDAHGGATIALPPSAVSALIPRPGEWITVDVSSRGARLEQVVLSRSLFDSEMLFGYSHLDRPERMGGPVTVALDLWREFSRAWERFASRLGDEGVELAADIALGVVARRYYLAATVAGTTIMAATPDPIVAEIAGRALLRLRPRRDNDMMVVPWEEPLVQRAAELRLGAQTPDDVTLALRWNGGSAGQTRFDALTRDLADLIAVEHPSDSR